jgi:hypothetical protein
LGGCILGHQANLTDDVAQTTPWATTDPLGTMDPSAGSTVMLNLDAASALAMVKVA